MLCTASSIVRSSGSPGSSVRRDDIGDNGMSNFRIVRHGCHIDVGQKIVKCIVPRGKLEVKFGMQDSLERVLVLSVFGLSIFSKHPIPT